VESGKYNAMNLELIISMTPFFSFVVIFVIIALSVWMLVSKNTKDTVSYSFLLSQFIVLSLMLWDLFHQQKYSTFIVLVVLIQQLYLLIKQSNNSTKERHNFAEPLDLIEQAKEQERSRIYANLHDDVGASLLQLIYSAENNKTKETAKQVLQKVRTAVASTINIQCSVEQLAQEIVYESQMRLKSSSIQLSKYLDISEQKLSAEIPNVISRIVREVISNIIKHSQAKHVKISIDNTAQKLNIHITDDGIGLPASSHTGKGLKTIQKRANSINAQVKWQTAEPSGCHFSLIYLYEH